MLLIYSSRAFCLRTSPLDARPSHHRARPIGPGCCAARRAPACLAPDGLPSLARARRHHPRLWRARDIAGRGAGALPVRSRGAIKAAPSSRELTIRVRQAAPQSWERPVPVSGDRGLASFTLRVNEPACRTDRRCARGTSLRSLHASQIVTPVTRHARCRAAEESDRGAPARPPRQSLRFVSRQPQSRRRSDLAGVFTASVAPGELSHPPRRCDAFVEMQPARLTSHRAPPSCAPVLRRGGLVGGSIQRWVGKPAHCFGCVRRPPIPHPFP